MEHGVRTAEVRAVGVRNDGHRAGRRLGSAASRVTLPLLGFGIVITSWWAATAFLDIRPIVLPSPQSVLDELTQGADFLQEHAVVTLTESMIGYALTTVGGIIIGVIIANWRVMDQAASPWLVALNAIPKVALAPLLVVWLDFGIRSRVAMVMLMCFFPIVLATTTGFKSTPSELVELSRSLEAPRWRTFVKVRFPYALPQIFVGLKIAMPLAVVGAVIGEFRGTDGLGQIVVRSSAQADTALAFAAITVLSIMSVVLYYALVGIERFALPWVRATTS